jgi:hypothetical protein
MKPSGIDDIELDERLSRYLRRLMNAPMPVGFRRLMAADVRDHPRPKLASKALAVAVVVATVAVAAVVVVATHRSSVPPGPSATPPATSTSPPPVTPTPAPLSATLVLPTRTMKAGGGISGQVVVENRTGQALRVTGCGGIFQVALTSSTYHPMVAWPACLQRITIPSGRSTYPVSVFASYEECGMSGPSGTMTACLPTGSPPLPPGSYEATTFEDGGAIPAPSSVAVTVTP